MKIRHVPELLAPAGSWEAMVAAVQAGADALYLGAGDFNARRSATNFEGELRNAVRYCQARGVKVYVTLNTLVRQDELERLEATIVEVCRSGADGVIVQDIGTVRALRQMAPSIPLHASTQLAAHNAQAVGFLASQGFSRVVLAREMSHREIARCADQGAQLEVFVHGALCVSCSGQCLMSSMIGGRSGNRGLCAQPCRQRYTFDGQPGYWLSARDLCALDDLPALADAGVASLKIEGRLKRAEYVALTTSVYRAALDALKTGVPFDVAAARRELAQMFNRGGFTRGYGPGLRDAELMYAERPNHLGVEIGRCRINGEVELSEAVDARDALALRRPAIEDRIVPAVSHATHRQGVEPGRCRTNGEIDPCDAQTLRRPTIEERSSPAVSHTVRKPARGAGGCESFVTQEQGKLSPVPHSARFEDIPVRLPTSPAGHAVLPGARRGDVLVRLTSEAQLKRLREESLGEKRKFPVSARLKLCVNAPAELEFSDGAHSVTVQGELVQPARSLSADPVRIRAQIARLGDTPYELCAFHPQIEAAAYLPISALNALRRSAAEALTDARCQGVHPCRPLPDIALDASDTSSLPELIVQSGDPAVLRRALDAGADFACFAPEDLRPEALDAALSLSPDRFDLTLPPVMGTTTLDALNGWARSNASRIRRVLLTNIGQFGLNWPGERVGDHPLNIANALAVTQLAAWGVKRYTPSMELNHTQINALGGARELVVYGRIPLMQLRHCPLRAVQGLRGAHSDCRHCDACAPDERTNAKALTDRLGARFPLRRIASDEGCVVQLLNSATLMLLRRRTALPAARAWRLLLDETDPIEAVVRLHRLALAGADPRSDSAWPALDALDSTTGHYFRGVE